MKYGLMMFMVLLAGCATAKRVKGPNGGDAWLVQCGNAVQSKCAEKAADLCAQGYNLLDRKADAYDDQTKVGNLGKLELKADTTTTLLIQCK